MTDDLDLPGFVANPIIVIHGDGEDQRHIIDIAQVDEAANEPALFGILISDLVDHVAKAYHDLTDAPESAIKARIMRAILDENRFKCRDPERWHAIGRIHKGPTS